jgi:hypothetical protein
MSVQAGGTRKSRIPEAGDKLGVEFFVGQTERIAENRFIRVF